MAFSVPFCSHLSMEPHLTPVAMCVCVFVSDVCLSFGRQEESWQSGARRRWGMGNKNDHQCNQKLPQVGTGSEKHNNHDLGLYCIFIELK